MSTLENWTQYRVVLKGPERPRDAHQVSSGRVPQLGSPETGCPEKMRCGLELRKYLGPRLLEGWLPFNSQF